MPEAVIKIEKMAVKELFPYVNNAKIHTEKQIGEIAASVQENGICKPVGIWTNEEGQEEIVYGHGLVLALKKLGIDYAPVVKLDHLTDEQRRIFTHVDNQTTLSTGNDYETLVEEMDNLNADWSAYGFEEYLYKDNVDAIEDLMTEDFSTRQDESDKETFSFSLVFPIEQKEIVEAYVKEVGRDFLSERIIKEAQEWV